MSSSALLTDQYELTMLEGALASGVAGRRAVFEVFARSLPDRRRYAVFAGTGRLLDALARFRFGPEEIDFLDAAGIVDRRTLDFLAGFAFSGDVDGYREGEAYFPGSPVLVVEAPFGEAVLLETIVLSILNHDSAVASAAARMVSAAGDRPVIEMGARRTHERDGVAAARATYVAGFGATASLAASQDFGVPTTGTSAHAFTLVHDDERTAFEAQVAALGSSTTLLVDTCDVEQGIRTAVDVAGPQLGAIRLDSGDLSAQAVRARELLDELGATGTRIVVTSDLDEYAIAGLAVAPVDTYGVGTSVVTGSGAPTANLVYKLVARADSDDPRATLRPVHKRSVGKASRGGRKWASRRLDEHGRADAELVHAGAPQAAAGARPLQTPLVRGGQILEPPDLASAREHCARVLAELPPSAQQLSPGDPAIPTVFEEDA